VKWHQLKDRDNRNFCRDKCVNSSTSSHGDSKLGKKDLEIKMLLDKKVLELSLAKIMDVSRSALLYFISSRKLL
jgi:hypothetical protein